MTILFFIVDKLPDGESSESYLEWLYSYNDFGYGKERAGIAMLMETSEEKISLAAYGSKIASFFSDNVLSNVAQQLSDYAFGQNPSGVDFIDVYISSMSELVIEENLTGSGNEAVPAEANTATNENGMPYWYPLDVASFKDFHDYDAPRVVDNADIFTSEEEFMMLNIIESIQSDSGKDIVVFTDVSSYGLSHAVYAADFHQFNGYGFGDDYTGTVLLICMEEGNRGWWTAATGECQAIYTEDVVNDLDDKLEPYMVNGDYGDGVIDYLYNVYDLYDLPDWYPADPESFMRFHKSSAEAVVDESGVLTAGQKDELQQRIATLKAEHSADVLIYITDSLYMGKTIRQCTNDCFLYNGCGLGEDYDGAMLGIYVDDGDIKRWNVDFSGQRPYYSDETRERLLKRLNKKGSAADVYMSVSAYLDALEKTYQKGHAPKTYDFFMTFATAIVLGAAAAFGRTQIMKNKMKTVKRATQAASYIVPGSLRLISSRDIFLGSTVTKTTKPKEPKSGGGKSSYSGGYSSSGGRSYSGGGRKF